MDCMRLKKGFLLSVSFDVVGTGGACVAGGLLGVICSGSLIAGIGGAVDG